MSLFLSLLEMEPSPANVIPVKWDVDERLFGSLTVFTLWSHVASLVSPLKPPVGRPGESDTQPPSTNTRTLNGGPPASILIGPLQIPSLLPADLIASDLPSLETT